MADSPQAAPQVSVVLPTYNEALTLPVLVPRIFAALAEAGIVGEVVVVDDDSPDGTAAVARTLGEQHAVRVLHRTRERGLATAVLAGFDMSQAPVCIVMDADGSHPTEVLPTMVQLILDDKADLVVGSRNLTGGGSRNWSVFSQIKSRFAAFLAFGVTSMTDPTTGFMAVRRSLLEGLPLNPVGWKIVLEIAAKAAPARIAEVPIVFSDRELGESKQSLLVFGQYLRHLAQLYAFRFPALAEFVRFCIVGLSGLFVDLGTVITIKERFGLDTRLCAVFGFSAAVTTNFWLNRRWTFKRQLDVPLLWSYATFVFASLLGLSVRILVMHGLIEIAGLDQGHGYILTNLVGIVLATAVNFLGAKFFAFDPERLHFTAVSDAPSSASAAGYEQRLALSLRAIIGISLCGALASSLWLSQLRTTDEVVNLTMARNIAESAQHFIRPSVFAGGHADWVRDDLPLLGNLPLYPALLAAFDSTLGERGGFLLSLLALAITLFATGRLLGTVHRLAGLFAAALLASTPAILDLFSYVEFEPLLVALGMIGLWLFTVGCRDGRATKSALGGALAGLSFLVKMWLVTPFVLAAVAFLVVQSSIARAVNQPSALRRTAIVGFAAFVLTAASHLALIALVALQDLPRWTETVYLGLFTGHGVSGTKLSGAGLAGQLATSAWYYPLQLYRDHAHVLALFLLGLPALLRKTQAPSVRASAMAFAACLGLVLLSVPAAKEPLYLLTVLPFVYGLAALSLSALVHADARYHYVDATMARFVAVLSGLGAVTAILLWLLAATPFGSQPWTTGTHAALLCGVSLLAWRWAQRPTSLPTSAFSVMLLGFGLWIAQVSTTAPATSPSATAATSRAHFAMSRPSIACHLLEVPRSTPQAPRR